MLGSIRLGRIAGIEIKMHLLFLLLVAWVGLDGLLGGGATGALMGVVYLGFLFGFVVLHELGHSLVAQRLGYRVRDITLLPFGGAARMESQPSRPGHEILIALSGPAVNVALALLLLPLVIAAVPLSVWSPAPAALAGILFFMNAMLAGFNLLPAFPMDGGRVLRGILALRRDRLVATRIAAKVGRVIAVLMAVAGVLYPPMFMLVFIALFVWFAGKAEENAVAMQTRWARPAPFEVPLVFFDRRRPW